MIAASPLAALAIAQPAPPSEKVSKAPPKRMATAQADPVLVPEPR